MKFRTIILSACFLALVSGRTEARTAIDPADPGLSYTGRWEFSDPAAPWSYWIGSSLRLSFSGTGLQATMAAGASGRPDFLRIIIDGQAADSQKIAVGNTVEAYQLAAGLTDSQHQVEIIKETDLGRWTVHALELEGDGFLLDPAARPPRRMVFYGDSNLAGYSLESEQNEGDEELRGAYRGYAGIAARMLDAEFQNISRSGATISSLDGVFDRMDYGSSTPLYDFERFAAGAVIVNVGANDVGRPVHVIKSDYHDLLDDLRAAHPAAHIVVYNAWGWDYDEPAGYTHEVVAERDDPLMSCAVFPWIFEQWHGCEYDHGGMAQVLANHLTAVLGWNQTAADVMCGFALHGDFANGGFEQAAPFGGYGWRYYTDPGVERLQDPSLAHSGAHFLRLAGGAATHQPIPAAGGEEFLVALWLRGGQAGQLAVVTLDFRDQQMWTEPVAAHDETVTLSTEWQRHLVAAVAPADPSQPVFHARLTVTSAPESVVDVDDVARLVSSSATDQTSAAPVLWLKVSPNPGNPRVNLEFTMHRPSPASLAVYDVSGRRVAQLARGIFPAGRVCRTWDGRDEQGRPVGSGTYFARLESGGITRVQKFAMVK